ncbi:hypothetical protein HDU97_009674 [Phlyctochytrium planicorne]|nr:hypothetical protein HDU97_009674 [Phlyctochytrium planicorne]
MGKIMDMSPEILASLSTPINEILPNLFLGNLLAAVDPAILEENKVTHIIKAVDEPTNLDRFSSLILPLRDHPDENIRQYFDHTYEFIEGALGGGGRVLVHCHQGVSRSATIVVAYVMRKFEVSLDEALQSVKEKRFCVDPNVGFRAQLQDYEVELMGRCQDEGS